MRWRKAVAYCISVNLDEMDGFVDFGAPCTGWDEIPLHNGGPDPLIKLLHHSDCDGEIPVEDQIALAERLEEIVPLLEDIDRRETPAGHLAHLGHAGAARRFAAGLRLANSLNEPVEFH